MAIATQLAGEFKIASDFRPTGDQPQAIDRVVEGVDKGMRHQTLMGVTGSGKTFTMACAAERIQRPTLVIAHNKTLAAQLATEFKEFLPDNAVEYFVSYYDYYQPEAYLPRTDTYIEKDADVNEELDKLRHSATRSLLTRRDVLIVASVSCIFGLGSPEEYQSFVSYVRKGRPAAETGSSGSSSTCSTSVTTSTSPGAGSASAAIRWRCSRHTRRSACASSTGATRLSASCSSTPSRARCSATETR